MSARLLHFPVHRRIGFARQTAAALLSMPGYRRQPYWDRLIARLKSEMRRAGCTTAQIDDDLSQFWQVVNEAGASGDQRSRR